MVQRVRGRRARIGKNEDGMVGACGEMVTTLGDCHTRRVVTKNGENEEEDQSQRSGGRTR